MEIPVLYAAALISPLATVAAIYLEYHVVLDTRDVFRAVAGFLTLALIGSVFFLLLLVTYRLTLHPLAKYPGPCWARVTDWRLVYHCWRGDNHLDYHELHCRYGNIVRCGPNRISVNTNTALRDIYSIRANVQKAHFYTVFRYFFQVPMIVTTIDRKDHGFKRRIVSQSLTTTAINAMEDSLLSNTRNFCQHVLDRKPSTDWNNVRNMTEWTAFVTSDIMGNIAFNRNWNIMENEENRHILTIISRGVAGLNLSGHMPEILKLKLDKILFRSLMDGVRDFQALSKAQSDWRLAHRHVIKTKDLFATLLEAKDPETGDGFTKEQIVAETGALLLAGSDTVATTLAATFFYCLHYPATLDCLQREIRTVFNNVEDIRISAQLSSCRYLRACLDESLRLSPPIGGLLPREVLPGGLIVDGQRIPEGVDVGVPHYAIHHNKMYYPEPFSFKPERWIVSSPTTLGPGISEAAVALAHSAFCAFGVGRTSCVGKTLAYTEMSIILARIVWLYDLRLQPCSVVGEGNPRLGTNRSRKDEFQTWDGFFSIHDGPLVQFKPRLPYELQYND